MHINQQDMKSEQATSLSEKTDFIVHFAHANGFPAKSYMKLFKHLAPNVALIALEKFGHTNEYPLSNNWGNQVDELIHYVESQRAVLGKDLSVVLVGHSFGAVISYLACCKKPNLFAGVIMLDPPLITGLASWVFRWAKKGKLIDRITPAGKTKMRNTKWHHKTDLVQYFKSRALFKNMDTDCIADYVLAVTQEHKEERFLNFDVQVETNIFRTIPDNLHKYYGKLSVPGFLFTGKYTDVCVPKLRNSFLKGNPSIVHEELDFGGHMYPLEKPIEVAHKINRAIEQLSK